MIYLKMEVCMSYIASTVPTIVALVIGVGNAFQGSRNGSPNSDILWSIAAIVLALQGLYWKIHEVSGRPR